MQGSRDGHRYTRKHLWHNVGPAYVSQVDVWARLWAEHPIKGSVAAVAGQLDARGSKSATWQGLAGKERRGPTCCATGVRWLCDSPWDAVGHGGNRRGFENPWVRGVVGPKTPVGQPPWVRLSVGQGSRVSAFLR